MGTKHEKDYNRIHESKCYTCGQLFYSTNEWVYKCCRNGRIRKFCSYNCMQGKEYKELKDKAWNEAYQRRWNK